jgi:transcriptional regulator with XRE-family HTH domain
VKEMSLSPSDARLFRERLASLRKSKGYTQASLSEAIGKGEKYVSRVETGEIDTPPLDTIADIAKQLEVAIADLFFTAGMGDTADDLRAKIHKLVATDDLPTLRRYYRLLLVSTE